MENIHRDGGLDRRVLNNIRFNARRLATSRAIPGMDVDDYEQELVLDLCRRSEAFDPARATFRTFADRVVRNRISTLVAPTNRLQQDRKMISLDAKVADVEGEERPLIEHIPDGQPPIDDLVSVSFDVKRFIEGLDSPLRDCCAILLDDSIAAGARAAGIHRSTVYERVHALRQRAEAHGLASYLDCVPDTSAGRPVSDVHGRSRSGCAEQNGSHGMSTIISFPTMPRCESEADFSAWLDQASPGDRLEYHRGFLMIDRMPRGRLAESKRQELVRIADRAMWAAERGLVHLLQKRHRVHDYSYIAVARPRGKSTVHALLGAAEKLPATGHGCGA